MNSLDIAKIAAKAADSKKGQDIFGKTAIY